MNRLHLDDRCFLLDDRNDVHEYYQAMDVFLLPSIFEGLPIVLIEAQVSGLPCVVSEHITCEADITGNVMFIPIEKGYDVWNDAICYAINKLTTDERHIWSGKIRNSEYDIAREAVKLEKRLDL